MKKQLTCIGCPMGCEITVELDENNEIIKISGNSCQNGENYARNEVTHPMRQVTSTVVIHNAMYKRLPVILSSEIPKEKIFAVMAEINKVITQAPVKRGDIIIENVCNLGVNVIASKSMSIKKEKRY